MLSKTIYLLQLRLCIPIKSMYKRITCCPPVHQMFHLTLGSSI